MNAETQTQAVIGTPLDLVLMPSCLREMLERLREAHDEDRSGKEFAEARGHMQQLIMTIDGLVGAMEQQASETLMNRLVEREREREDRPAQFAQMEARVRYYQDLQVDSASDSIMADELRRGAEAGHATARDTLQRFGSRSRSKVTEGHSTFVSLHVRSFLLVPPGRYIL